MAVKSSRFSRMAYSRRAALLAEDLDEWRHIYHSMVMSDGDWGEYDHRVPLYAERDRQLHELVGELQDIAFRLQALR